MIRVRVLSKRKQYNMDADPTRPEILCRNLHVLEVTINLLAEEKAEQLRNISALSQI